MQTRTLGTPTTGRVEVSAIGLGEMPLSLADRPDRQQAIRTVHAALDAGVTFIDTADAYCADASDFGHGEELLAEALGRRIRRRAGRHQGRPHPGCRRRLGDRRLPGPPPQGLRRQPRAARRRRDRALPAPPARPRGPVRGDHRRAQGAVRRRQDPDGRDQQRGPGPDPHRAGHPRRRAGQRAEPVLARTSGPASPSCGCAPSWGWRSCPGARSAGSAGPAGSPSRRTSPRWPTRTGSARSRCAWPGCWRSRRRSSRSPARPARRPSPTRQRRPTSASPTPSSAASADRPRPPPPPAARGPRVTAPAPG